MKRAVMVLGLVAAAGAGAYGQNARPVFQDAEIFNYRDVYRASLCSDRTNMTDSVSANNFMMRVKRPLANNWYEVDVSSYLDPATNALRAPVDTVRINAAQLCYLKPIVP